MKFSATGALSPAKNQTLVTFSFVSKKDKEETINIGHKGLEKQFQSAIEDKVITGKHQEVVLFREIQFEGYKNIIVAGLGTDWDAEKVRQVGACLQTKIESSHLYNLDILFDTVSSTKKQMSKMVGAFVEGFFLNAYKFDELKSKKNEAKDKKKEQDTHLHLITKHFGDKELSHAIKEAEAIVECVNFSRRLGDMPGNLMTPTILANTVMQEVKGTGIRAEIWDKVRIKKEKMGGLLGVSQGSDQDPRFIILRYNGAAKSKKPIALVGKGLTFDSGGISLKPGTSMEEMKYDMCGGANVLGGMLAIAKLKLKVNAIAIVPASENMPGPSATKPGDVHTGRNGKTFEINNTDAEGRLILADALAYASEQEPAVILDAATLTGAMVIALGSIHSGYFTKNKEIKEKIEKAADQSGELVWHMPLCEHHTKDIKGTFADLSNISSSKGAGSATAAAFLEQFVGEGIPWAHFDIAGTAWAVGSRIPYCSKKGASGVLVRTFVEFAKQYE